MLGIKRNFSHHFCFSLLFECKICSKEIGRKTGWIGNKKTQNNEIVKDAYYDQLQVFRTKSIIKKLDEACR